jgi:hypothetical protein
LQINWNVAAIRPLPIAPACLPIHRVEHHVGRYIERHKDLAQGRVPLVGILRIELRRLLSRLIERGQDRRPKRSAALLLAHTVSLFSAALAAASVAKVTSDRPGDPLHTTLGVFMGSTIPRASAARTAPR